MVRELRQEVRQIALSRAQHAQTPSYYDQLLEDVYFSPKVSATPQPPVCAALVREDASRYGHKLSSCIAVRIALVIVIIDGNRVFLSINPRRLPDETTREPNGEWRFPKRCMMFSSSLTSTTRGDYIFQILLGNGGSPCRLFFA